MKNLFKREETKVDYQVRAGKEHSKTWPNRRMARCYRDLLKDVGVQAEIWKREWEKDGLPFLRRETKVH